MSAPTTGRTVKTDSSGSVAGASAASQALFRSVMSRFATGVTVVTASVDGEVLGMTANAFMAGSLVPPLCVISIGRAAKMHAHIQAAGRFGVSFLSEQQLHLSQHFARKGSAGVQPAFRVVGDIPVLEGGVGAVAAEVAATAACGDHTLFIGRIIAMDFAESRPLVFYGGRYATLDRERRLDDGGLHSFW
jgi:flavin reductase (DIM6/NTAB) family NADH-FMN oxidoreductase RutF